MLKQYLKFVKLNFTFQFGEIDFSADHFGIEIIKSLYENGFPYLEIKDKGKNEQYDFETTMEKVLTKAKPRKQKN